MVKKIAAIGALCAGLAVLSGCYSAPVMPPNGMLFSSIQAPLNCPRRIEQQVSLCERKCKAKMGEEAQVQPTRADTT